MILISLSKKDIISHLIKHDDEIYLVKGILAKDTPVHLHPIIAGDLSVGNLKGITLALVEVEGQIVLRVMDYITTNGIKIECNDPFICMVSAAHIAKWLDKHKHNEIASYQAQSQAGRGFPFCNN